MSCVAGKYSETVGAGSHVCVSCVAGKYSETVRAGSDVCVIQKEHIQALYSHAIYYIQVNIAFNALWKICK